MNDTQLAPILGLDDEFPEHLVVLSHPASSRYGCYRYEGIHGLACFSSEYAATRFAELANLKGMSTELVSFDEARIIAQERPLPIVAIMLLDRIEEPIVHYVR